LVYFLSKAFWLVVQPGNLLVLLAVLGALLLFTRWRRFGRGLVLLAALLLVVVAVLPGGEWLLAPLENRFPPLTQMPDHVDGIIMLGGAASTLLTAERRQPIVNDHAERFIAFADLARRYPQAKLVFTGGGLSLDGGRFREADAAREVLQWMGMDTGRVIFERESRNTFENVADSKALVHPAPGETWILITSAFHMPRSVGLFRAQGWPVIPDPVDYQTGTGQYGAAGFGIDLAGHLDLLSLAVKEWIGLLVNRVMGHSDSFLPGPEP
jgi:uncharacterized SAM-binding protein YcdF (DUF218 family)